VRPEIQENVIVRAAAQEKDKTVPRQEGGGAQKVIGAKRGHWNKTDGRTISVGRGGGGDQERFFRAATTGKRFQW